MIVAEARRDAEIAARRRATPRRRASTPRPTRATPSSTTFVRSLEAYRKTLGERTTLVLPPEHEFFHSFNKGGSDLVAGPRAPAPSRLRRRRVEAP